MTIVNILALVIANGLTWFITYMCLRKKGCNWFMLSGYLTMPKEERLKYKAKFDVIAMNRYAGKMIHLPLAILMVLLIPLPFYQGAWYGAVLGIYAVMICVLSFIAVSKLFSNEFEVSNPKYKEECTCP